MSKSDKVIHKGPNERWQADYSPYSLWFQHKNLKTHGIKTVDFSKEYTLNENLAKCPYIYVPGLYPGDFQCACPDDMESHVEHCAAKPIKMLVASNEKRPRHHRLISLDLKQPYKLPVDLDVEGDDTGQINVDYHYDYKERSTI